MEQNKVLMIVISVAVFLAAIVGVGVALLYPRSADETTPVATRGVQEFDPIEYVRQPEAEPLTPIEEPEEPVIIVYGAEESTSVDPVVPESSVPATSRRPEPPVTEEPRTFGPSRTAATPTTPTASTTSTAPQARDEVRESSPAQRTTEYWIQLIASPSRDRVEQAREYLEENSLGGRITTRDVDGTTYYRLRVGPYEYREEAEKFLDWIHQGELFTDAYISEEYPLL